MVRPIVPVTCRHCPKVRSGKLRRFVASMVRQVRFDLAQSPAFVTGEHLPKTRHRTFLFFGCACAQPRQINPFGQCSPVGKAHRCVPMSRRLQLAAKAAHSSAVGFFNPASP
jgi:hypothetical protein